MRQVSGSTEHVVVVGAGLGGLSAALRLAGAGRQVTVLERSAVPGGRAGLLLDGDYVFDTGPSVLTMPTLIAEALECVGESMDDWLTLDRLAPAYRARFADGSALDVHASVDAMADEVAAVCGPREADGYRRLVGWLTQLYRLEMRDFIDRNLDSPMALLRPSLARLAALGGFRRLGPKVGRFVRGERLQRVFSFQALYAGLSPYDALALYAVIGYLDAVAGVYVPRGGMHAVPRALAGAAEKHGVELRYGEQVTSVDMRGRRAVAVTTASGLRLRCDALVLNADLPAARRLVGAPVPRRLRYSPSCFLLLAGSTATYPDGAHHTISFGGAWREVFDDLAAGRLMRDPSFLVTSPAGPLPGVNTSSRDKAGSAGPPGPLPAANETENSRDEVSRAGAPGPLPGADIPQGSRDRASGSPGPLPVAGTTYSVLFPTPNLDGPIDWAVEGPRYRDDVVRTLEARGWPGFADGIEVEHVTTPLDWAVRGLERGTPFSLAHTFGQTGPFRPRNLWGENVVFTGCGTTPGVGVPMVLVSGRLAAERILGPDPAYRSRTWL